VSFTQTMKGQTNDELALRDHVAGRHTEQAGIARGYRQARVRTSGLLVCTTEEA